MDLRDFTSSSVDWEKHIPRNAECFGEGESYLILDVLPQDLVSDVFQCLCKEVKWESMSHRGGDVPRLVAVEGEIGQDGSFPIYRHPSDTAPPLFEFSPTVRRIRDHVSSLLRQPLNHVLVQWYRNGNDYIAEHADKTIDIVRGSAIVNVSIGTQRTMILRAKKGQKQSTKPLQISTTNLLQKKDIGQDHNAHVVENDGLSDEQYDEEDEENHNDVHSTRPPRKSQRVPLPHNSLFVLGPETNRKWTHGIKPDKRIEAIKTDEEIGSEYGGGRISLTFRWIGTFLSPRSPNNTVKVVGTEGGEDMVIWGQGAIAKTREEAHSVTNGGDEAAQLLRAFGEENRDPLFDWERSYGRGFNVVHLT